MKEQTITTYTLRELKEHFPEAYEKALNYIREGRYGDGMPWGDEIMDSFKAIFEHAGVDLVNYQIDGISGPSSCRVRFPAMQNEDFTGHRAFAWVENNLLGPLRIKFTPLSDKTSRRRQVAPYGSYYRPGCVLPCPFTGVCFDDDFIDGLIKALRDGCTLKEAFEGLADIAGRLRENEYEQMQSEETILEESDGNFWEFTQDGRFF